MKHIAYIFTSGDSFVSKAIKLQTWGDVNHTAFEFVQDAAVIQIQHPRVIAVPPSALLNTAPKAYRFVLEANDQLYDEALAFAKSDMVGKRYDWLSVGRFTIPLRNAFGHLAPVKRMMSNQWFCSEGAEVLGRKCEKGLVRKTIEPARVSPQSQFESVRLEDETLIYQEYVKGELVYSGLYIK